MVPKFESRLLTGAEFETRQENGREIIRFTPIQYNKWSEVLGGFFREKILPGAADHLLDGEIISLVNHDNNQILGRTTNNRLSLKREGANIVAEVTPPEGLSYVADLKINIAERNIIGSSFRFTVGTDGETWDTSKEPYERTISKFSGLYEVGPVTNPAYKSDTTILTKRDIDDRQQEPQPPEIDHDKETQELNDVIDSITLTT